MSLPFNFPHNAPILLSAKFLALFFYKWEHLQNFLADLTRIERLSLGCPVRVKGIHRAKVLERKVPIIDRYIKR